MARSTTERSDRLLGRIPRASRAPPTSIDWRRPILPWALLVFLQACRVLFHSTPRRSFVERVSSRTANRRGPLSVGRHPLMGFTRDCCRDACSGTIHIIPCAQGVPGTGSIENRFARRHPCRRWPFSVFGRSAPGRSERFEAVTSVFEDVLPFRTDFLSEVSHRPV